MSETFGNQWSIKLGSRILLSALESRHSNNTLRLTKQNNKKAFDYSPDKYGKDM